MQIFKFSQYQETNDIECLRDAIRKQLAATEATPANDPGKMQRHDSLSIMSAMLYDATKEEGALGDAVFHARQALRLIDSGSPYQPRLADRLAAWLTKRFLLNQQISDLNKAIRVTAAGLRDTDENNDTWGPLMYHMSNRFELKYEHQGRLGDLMDAVGFLFMSVPSFLRDGNLLKELLQKLHDLLNLALIRFDPGEYSETIRAAVGILRTYCTGMLIHDAKLMTLLNDLQKDLLIWQRAVDANNTDTAFHDSRSTHLCDLCRAISFKSFQGFSESKSEQILPWTVQPDWLFYKHHRSLEALRTSASNGCWFCSHILFGFDNYDYTRDAHPTSLSGIWFSLDPTKSRISGMPQTFLVSYEDQYLHAFMREYTYG
jgi:hypothetical protein